MPKRDSWIKCDSCETEFKVVSESTSSSYCCFCPFCGTELDDSTTEDSDQIDEDELDQDFDF